MAENLTIIEIRIRSLRERLGYSQNKVANSLGISRSLIASWENGYANISLKQLIKLASFYQVPLDYLLGIIDEVDHYSYHYIDNMDLMLIGKRLWEIRKSEHLTQ